MTSAPPWATPRDGLSAEAAARALAEQGPNELHRDTRTRWWRLLLGQFASPLVALLGVACAVSLALGEVADAVAILVILVINALVGFIQEYRAENTVLALRALTAPKARVLRDGSVTVVAAREVVVGDILLLEAGEIVAADGRLINASALATQEAMLTGESAQVDKRAAPVLAVDMGPGDTPLAEQRDRVFMGTFVARGSGHARVTATGMRTEMGRIAHLLQSAADGPTPLQARLAKVGRTLLVMCVGVVALVALIGLVRGQAALDVFMSAVSLAVAAVPEGLPALVTIALALGVRRMAARNVLVRKLPSVETLGCTTIICTDKTGTLTTGVMSVRELWGPDEYALLDAAAACSEAHLDADGRAGIGDTTELAILVAAAERGIWVAHIDAERPRVRVEPFDPDTKRATFHRADGRRYVKGALEVVLPLTLGRAGAVEAATAMAGRGLRVLAVAVGEGEAPLCMLGLVGIADPPRGEAIAAIAAAKRAGIDTIMITGDHPITACAIGRELGLIGEGQSSHGIIHARATPADKLRVVRELKARGEIVAMTGDGVNDAPALREAHIGIAMGRSGSEVTREASDLVLADDNVASLVAAVREGRGIFDNIRKTLVYLLTGNFAELLVMLAAAVAGLPLPLLPLQLLWVNLVTDGMPALALVMDRPDPDVLARPPRRTDEPMLGRAQWRSVLAVGALQATVVLCVYAWALDVRGTDAARALTFSTLVFSELFRAFGAHPTRTTWQVGIFSNVRLLAVVVMSVALQIAIDEIPAAQAIFQIGPLAPGDLVLSLALGLVTLLVVDATKLFRRARGQSVALR